MPPPRPLPSLATVQTTVEVLVGQIKGMRLDIEALGKLVREQPLDVRIASSAPPAPLTPQPRPSMAAKAAHGGSKVAQIVMIATGILTVAGQIAAVWKPQYTGPIVQALRLLASLGGGDP